MKRAWIAAMMFGVLAASSLHAEERVDMARRAEELKNLRWGMFVCWSFSTFSGKEWTPDVKDVAFFKATDCDTDQWARAAKDAGMGYNFACRPKNSIRTFLEPQSTATSSRSTSDRTTTANSARSTCKPSAKAAR